MLSQPVELIQQCLAGDQRAMVELVSRYQGRVFGLCFRMLGHRQDAEDVTQETFIRALKSLKNWDQNRQFEPWLLAIAGNRCRTALATRTRRPKTQTLEEPVSETSSSELQAAKQLAEEIDLVLAELREEHRQAFVMFHQAELSYDQISESMKRPIGTVKTWIFRARRLVMDHLRRRDMFWRDNMQCDKFEQRLNEVLDNRERPEGDSQLVAHAANCGECNELLGAWDAVAIGLDVEETLSPGFAERVVQNALQSDIQPLADSTSKPLTFAQALPVFLGIAGVLLFAVMPLVLQPRGNGTRPSPQPEDVVVNPSVGTPAEVVIEPAPAATPDPARATELPTLLAALPGYLPEVNPADLPMEEIAGPFQPVTTTFSVAIEALRKTMPGAPSTKKPGDPQALRLDGNAYGTV